MHPSTFQLTAFGRGRLPAPQSGTVLRHLRSGCGRCRTALSPYLIPWLDAEPAAEARATDPARCDPALRSAYMRGAKRLARAAAARLLPPREDRSVRQALAILDAEGPSAIGRLPRHLLGWPTTTALLRQTGTLGPTDPRLRLRLAELASDIAAGTSGGIASEATLRGLRCQAAIELANAYRVVGDAGAAEEQLSRAARDLRGEHDPLDRARRLVIQANLLGDQADLAGARERMAAALGIYREAAQFYPLAAALASDGKILHDAGAFAEALERFLDAMRLLDSNGPLEMVGHVVTGICRCLMRMGRWREAASVVRQQRPAFDSGRGANAARKIRIEGQLLEREGDATGAERAFALSRRRHELLGQPYETGITLLEWAGLRAGRGDLGGARALVEQGTDILVEVAPGREVYSAMMLLRTTTRFNATRWTMPIEPVIDFLYRAWFNPAIRLEDFLS